jgi:hypothetical protein
MDSSQRLWPELPGSMWRGTLGVRSVNAGLQRFFSTAVSFARSFLETRGRYATWPLRSKRSGWRSVCKA